MHMQILLGDYENENKLHIYYKCSTIYCALENMKFNEYKTTKKTCCYLVCNIGMLKLSMDFSCVRVNMYVKAIKCFFMVSEMMNINVTFKHLTRQLSSRKSLRLNF